MNIILKRSLILGALLTFDIGQPAKAAIIDPVQLIPQHTNILDAYWHHGWHGHGRHGHARVWGPGVEVYGPPHCWWDAYGYRHCHNVLRYY